MENEKKPLAQKAGAPDTSSDPSVRRAASATSPRASAPKAPRASYSDGEPDSALLRFRHTFITPLLVGIVFILILITRTVDLSAVEGSATQAYLSTVAVQLFIFILPCVLYVRYRSLDVRDTLRIRIPAPDKLMLIALCSLFLIITSILVTALGKGGSVYTAKQVPEDPSAVVYFAVCFALVPALCEELLFRAVVMSEYQQSSILTAVVVSSLYFAMMHFDLARTPFYFLAGVVLSVCAFASGSVIASFAVHLIYNLFALFGGRIVERVLVSLSDPIPVILVLGALLLLVLSFGLGECQRIYAGYAKRNRSSEHVPKYKKGTGGVRFALALLSPTSLVVIVMFIITILVQ